MNGLRLQKTSDVKFYLVNGTLAIVTREQEARELDGMEHFLAFFPGVGQQRFGFLNPMLCPSTT